MFSRKRDAAGRFDSRESAPIHERFVAQVSPEAISGCWLWTGSPKNRYGHGAFKLGGRGTRVEFAHRYSYATHKGAIPEGMLVRHLCNNPACVNPEHLALGTATDNARDKIAAGTLINGEAHCGSKATSDLVRQMRSGSRADGIELGKAFGLSRQAAGDIMSNRTWRHVQ